MSETKCACTYEAGDSDCAKHPTCHDCGEPYTGRLVNEATSLRSDRDRLARELADTLAQLAAVRAERDEARLAFEQMSGTAELMAADQTALRAKLQAAEERAGAWEVRCEVTEKRTSDAIAAWLATTDPKNNSDGYIGAAVQDIRTGKWRQKEDS